MDKAMFKVRAQGRTGFCWLTFTEAAGYTNLTASVTVCEERGTGEMVAFVATVGELEVLAEC